MPSRKTGQGPTAQTGLAPTVADPHPDPHVLAVAAHSSGGSTLSIQDWPRKLTEGSKLEDLVLGLHRPLAVVYQRCCLQRRWCHLFGLTESATFSSPNPSWFQCPLWLPPTSRRAMAPTSFRGSFYLTPQNTVSPREPSEVWGRMEEHLFLHVGVRWNSLRWEQKKC